MLVEFLTVLSGIEGNIDKTGLIYYYYYYFLFYHAKNDGCLCLPALCIVGISRYNMFFLMQGKMLSHCALQNKSRSILSAIHENRGFCWLSTKPARFIHISLLIIDLSFMIAISSFAHFALYFLYHLPFILSYAVST